MYIDRSVIKKENGTTYERYLLRQSYRINGKVTKRTVANLSNCKPEEIEAMILALKHKDSLTSLGTATPQNRIEQGTSIGALWAIHQVAKEIGIVDALGSSKEGKYALWQVYARVLDQGSRLSAVRLARAHACPEVLGITTGFNEDSLYRNLDWLSTNQTQIEDRLFSKRYQATKPALYLYDVTSSYFEGQNNQLAAFGYNRDRKAGKKQLVAGLLCDQEGEPLSVQVFKGNTSDVATFGGQVEKAQQRFGASAVTFVGDRGMIKSQQVEQLTKAGYHYITALTKAQIEKLISSEVLQLSLFDNEVAEISTPEGIRYILRRNPIRAEEIKNNRAQKLVAARAKVADLNLYLTEHVKAVPEKALIKIQQLLRKLHLGGFLAASLANRTITLSEDGDALVEEAKLDGCYVIKSNLSATIADTQTVHARYKDLSKVEWAFRTSKTAHLELRPIYLRLEDRTRAHAFIVMLAYKIIRRLSSAWAQIDTTVEQALNELASLCLQTVSYGASTKPLCYSIPEPRKNIANLLAALNVAIPAVLPFVSATPVDTKAKLQKSRKKN